MTENTEFLALIHEMQILSADIQNKLVNAYNNSTDGMIHIPLAAVLAITSSMKMSDRVVSNLMEQNLQILDCVTAVVDRLES